MLDLLSKIKANAVFAVIAVFCTGLIAVNCTHEDDILVTMGPNINRGSERVTMTDLATAFDKSHSNVNWETAYLGQTSLLTGRFNTFGFNSFNFVENNKDSISFDA